MTSRRAQSVRTVGDGSSAILAFKEALNKPDFSDVTFKLISPIASHQNNNNLTSQQQQQHHDHQHHQKSSHSDATTTNTTETTIHAHRAILAVRSPVFKEMFFGGYPESRQKEVVVEDFKPEHFMTILEWAYTGQANMSARDVLGVLQAANYYGLDDLMLECRDLAQSFIDEENVLHLLEHASSLGETSLVVQCLNFIKSHAHAVLNSPVWLTVSAECVERVLALPAIDCEEALLFDQSMAWLEANTTLRSDVIQANKKAASASDKKEIQRQKKKTQKKKTTTTTKKKNHSSSTNTVLEEDNNEGENNNDDVITTTSNSAASSSSEKKNENQEEENDNNDNEKSDNNNNNVDGESANDDDDDDENESDDDEYEVMSDEDEQTRPDDSHSNFKKAYSLSFDENDGEDDDDAQQEDNNNSYNNNSYNNNRSSPSSKKNKFPTFSGNDRLPSQTLVRRFFRLLRLSHLSVQHLLDRVRPLLAANHCIRNQYIAALEYLVSPGHLQSVAQVPRAPTVLSTVQVDVPVEFLRGWKHLVSIPQTSNTNLGFNQTQLLPTYFFSEVPSHASYICVGEMVLGREDAISVIAVGCVRLVRPVIGSRTPVVAEDGDVMWHASQNGFGFTPKNHSDVSSKRSPVAVATPSARAQAGVRFMVATSQQLSSSNLAVQTAQEEGPRHGKRFIYYK